MHPSVKPISQNTSFNYTIVIKMFDGLSNEAALKKVTSNSNCLNWILGHLVRARHLMAGLAGVEQDNSFWAELYGRGSTFSTDKTYPDLEEIKEVWSKTSETLDKALVNLTEANLAEECPFPFHIKENNRLQGLGFLSFHEIYHIGQVGILRQELGLSKLFG